LNNAILEGLSLPLSLGLILGDPVQVERNKRGGLHACRSEGLKLLAALSIVLGLGENGPLGPGRVPHRMAGFRWRAWPQWLRGSPP
jgi:hypothetical protein